MVLELKHVYSVSDIIRILDQRSHEQDGSTPEGERMAYLLNMASQFLDFQDRMITRLRKELGQETKSCMVLSCPVDLGSTEKKEAAQQGGS